MILPYYDFRLTPSLGVVILISAYLLPQTNNGPFWPLTVEQYGKLCQSHFWRNLLYIHNFFPFEQMVRTNYKLIMKFNH